VLAEEGCNVALTYRSSRPGAERAAAVVCSHGRRAWVDSLGTTQLTDPTVTGTLTP